MADHSENMRKNTTLTSKSDTYEIKFGETVFVISHEYGKADLYEIVTDYLAKNVTAHEMKKAA